MGQVVIFCAFLHTVQLQGEEERGHGYAAASSRVLASLLPHEWSSGETIAVEASVPNRCSTKCAA
jgi:hypothetical protein